MVIRGSFLPMSLALTLDRKALARLDDDEKGVNSIHTLGSQRGRMPLRAAPLFETMLRFWGVP